MDDDRRAAFEELVRTRSAALLRTAYLLTGDAAHAEDLVQTALAKAYLRWGDLRDVGAGEAYVRRVLATTYGKWWRRRWRREIPTDLPRDSQVADHADDASVRTTVARALATLPPAQRAVVVLRFFDDLTEEQAAEVLRVPVGTVKSRTSRALATLRRLDLLDVAPPPAPATACTEPA